MTFGQKLSLAFLLSLLFSIGATVYLLGTATGLHLLINGVAKVVPGLKIASVDGFWEDLSLTGIEYHTDTITADINSLDLSLDIACLKNSQFCVNKLHVDGAAISMIESDNISASKTKKSSSSLEMISTPYLIDFRQLLLTNIDVAVGEKHLSFAKFSTAAKWEKSDFTLEPTSLDKMFITLPKSQQKVIEKRSVEIENDQSGTALAETLDSLFAAPLLSDELSSYNFPLNLAIKGIRIDNVLLQGESPMTLNHFHIKGYTQDNQINLQTLSLNASFGQFSAKGKGNLTKQWPVSFKAEGELFGERWKDQKIAINLSGEMKGTVKLDVKTTGGIDVAVKGSAQLAKAGLPLSLSIKSPVSQWPPRGISLYQVKNTDIQLQGQATDYVVTANSTVSGRDIPTTKINLLGEGSTEQFSLSQLRVNALEGTTDLTAVLKWRDQINLTSLLSFKGINSAKQWPRWPSTLEGDIAISANMKGNEWALSFPQMNLTGNVKQNAFIAKGRLSANSAGQWDIPNLQLRLGQNHLEASGTLDEHWNLMANIDAPYLDNALPGLAGKIRGKIDLKGERSAPNLFADVNANDVRWQDFSLKTLLLKANVKAAEQVSGTFKFDLSHLNSNDLDVKKVQFSLKGNEDKHQANLVIDGEPIAADLAVSGAFNRAQQHWKGQLKRADFDTPLGHWKSDQSINIDYRHRQMDVTLSKHCWLNSNAELCIPETIVLGKNGHAKLDVNKFDLAILQPFLGEETRMHGIIKGGAKLAWKDDGTLPQGYARLDGEKIKVEQEIEGQLLPVKFDLWNISVDLLKDSAKLAWVSKIENNGKVHGSLVVQDPMNERYLSGQLLVEKLSFGVLTPALLDGERAQGMMNSHIKFGGTVAHPELYGDIKLDQLDLDSQWVPFNMEPSYLTIKFDGLQSTLEGKLRTEEGEVALIGDADWRNMAQWRAKVRAKGSDLRLNLPPMLNIDLSPNILFEAKSNQMMLSGLVSIPYARLNIKELPDSAVEVSSDEVILDGNMKPILVKDKSSELISNLIIHLGNDVRLNAFGLDAQLKGDLQMAQNKHGMGLNGQISVPEGRFYAYGQDLLVQHGTLAFSGPIDEPMLNIEAIRNPDATENNVKAGVRVTGFLSDPKLEVFSSPAMSQEEALSYLLRGQPLDTSGSDSSTMTSMLIGLGVAQSGRFMGKIGDALGIGDLALDTKGVGDESQVVVSGYIFPWLQVKYGIGIFDSLSTFTLRYRVMPKLYLEAVSGLEQALDLLYQFEF